VAAVVLLVLLVKYVRPFGMKSMAETRAEEEERTRRERAVGEAR
jgi:hypothetical protein